VNLADFFESQLDNVCYAECEWSSSRMRTLSRSDCRSTSSRTNDQVCRSTLCLEFVPTCKAIFVTETKNENENYYHSFYENENENFLVEEKRKLNEMKI